MNGTSKPHDYPGERKLKAEEQVREPEVRGPSERQEGQREEVER